MRRVIAAGVMVVLMVLASGCAARRSAGGPARLPTIGDLEGVAFAPADVAPTTLLPEGPSGGTLIETGRSETPQRMPYRIERPAADTWVVTVDRWLRGTYVLDEAGALRVVREEDFTEDAMLTYEPGLVVLPAELAGAEATEGAAVVTVWNGSGDHVRHRGQVRYRTQVLGRTTLGAGGRLHDTVVTRMDRTMDLGLAKVRIETRRAWSAGQASVAELIDRRVQALGLFGTRVSYVLERTEGVAEGATKVEGLDGR